MRGAVTLRLEGVSFFRGEPGRVAIAVSLQTSHVVAFVFGVGQHLGFGGTEFRVITGFLPVFAGGEVALVFQEGSLFRLRGGKHGVIAIVPAVHAVLRVALASCGGRFLRFRKSQMGMIAESGAVLAVGCVELLPGTVHGRDFGRG